MKNKTNEAMITKITGTVTSAFYGPTKFDKEDKYHVSIKFAAGECGKLKTACADIYKNAGSFTPKWYSEDKAEYVNFKSNYDIPVLYRNEAGEKVETTLSKMFSEFGTVTGSEVIIAITLKEGAIYPRALCFIKLQTASIDGLFDDDLPF